MTYRDVCMSVMRFMSSETSSDGNLCLPLPLTLDPLKRDNLTRATFILTSSDYKCANILPLPQTNQVIRN